MWIIPGLGGHASFIVASSVGRRGTEMPFKAYVFTSFCIVFTPLADQCCVLSHQKVFELGQTFAIFILIYVLLFLLSRLLPYMGKDVLAKSKWNKLIFTKNKHLV